MHPIPHKNYDELNIQVSTSTHHSDIARNLHPLVAVTVDRKKLEKTFWH